MRVSEPGEVVLLEQAVTDGDAHNRGVWHLPPRRPVNRLCFFHCELHQPLCNVWSWWSLPFSQHVRCRKAQVCAVASGDYTPLLLLCRYLSCSPKFVDGERPLGPAS